MNRHYKSRASFLYIVLAVFWTYFLVSQLYDLQINRHKELSAEARKITVERRKEIGRRGKICDFSGNLLAGDFAVYDVSVYAQRCRKLDIDKLVEDFHKVFATPKSILKSRIEKALSRKKETQIVLAKDVSIELINTIKGFSSSDFSGINYPKIFKVLDYDKKYRRFYPTDKLLTHVIGYLGESQKYGVMAGQIGIEKVYDQDLQPRKMGEVSYQRAPNGSILNFDDMQRVEPEHGSDIFLTVQQPIQTIVEQELAKLVEDYDPKTAYVAMANPRTGAILAMAQYPTFDLNNRDSVKPDEMNNHCLMDYYEPGSVMKAISISAALDAGVVTLNSRFFCENGYWFYAGKRLKDSHSEKWLSVAQIVQKSSNIGTAKIAILLDERPLWKYFREFGFGQRTGINLGGEGLGILRSPAKWDKLSITRFPIGQGVSVTPIQMLQAWCAIANKGKMMQLYIVDRIVDPNNEKVKIFQPYVKRQVIKPETASEITKALCMVTEEGGTAKRAAIKGVKVAGKTGTSQKWDTATKSYSNSRYIASFVGFVPADAPEFVLMVVVDEPRKSSYGGVVSAPTFRRISERTLEYIKFSPLEKNP